MIEQQDVENAGLQAQAVEESSSRTNISDVGQYGVINTFTQLLMVGHGYNC
ncbi:Os03g0390800 [Oryza sativa Japonica Group]|uniref:Os03g0390800 protein n=1 Tax=Oryza sativa subsp. japonica TaxID=39947 RepID=C7J0R4_ORYSJ|nr:Os03g0390800 [Oryza sativa Japonica Group]|eukprot:NP_001173453.1 Os03g0390800 [Oryza sativa Japonica Group]